MTLTESSNLNVQQPFTYAKPEAASNVLAPGDPDSVQQPFTYTKEAASAVLNSW